MGWNAIRRLPLAGTAAAMLLASGAFAQPGPGGDEGGPPLRGQGRRGVVREEAEPRGEEGRPGRPEGRRRFEGQRPEGGPEAKAGKERRPEAGPQDKEERREQALRAIKTKREGIRIHARIEDAKAALEEAILTDPKDKEAIGAKVKALSEAIAEGIKHQLVSRSHVPGRMGFKGLDLPGLGGGRGFGAFKGLGGFGPENQPGREMMRHMGERMGAIRERLGSRDIPGEGRGPAGPPPGPQGEGPRREGDRRPAPGPDRTTDAPDASLETPTSDLGAGTTPLVLL